MKHISLFITSLIILTLAVSCKKATYINTDRDKITVGRPGGEETIHLSSDGSDYKLKYAPEWIKASIIDSTLTLSIEENTTQKTRADLVTINCNDISLSITVTQNYVCTYMQFENNTTNYAITFTKEGGTKTIPLETDASNLTFSEMDGVVATFTNGNITLSAEPNQQTKKTGQISITADSQTATIDITIEGSICARCHGAGTIKCPKCGGRGSIERVNDIATRIWNEPCTKCGGRGDGLLNDFGGGDPTYRKGSGKITCPECGGK